MYFVILCFVAFKLFKFVLSLFKDDPRGKWVVVTGAASGIGKCVVNQLLSKGCKVYALDLNEKLLEESFHSEHVFKVRVDISSSKEMSAFEERLKEDFKDKELYGLVNCAGLMPPGSPAKACGEIDTQKSSSIFDVNFHGTSRVIKTCIPHLIKSSGCIVSVISYSSRVPLPGYAIYASSKAALSVFCDVLRVEMKSYNVRVSSIQPLAVDTPMISHLTSQVDVSLTSLPKCIPDQERQREGMRRFGALTPDRVATEVLESLFARFPREQVYVAHNWLFYFLFYSLELLPFTFSDWLKRQIFY